MSHFVEHLPVHRCQSSYCTSQTGYWPGRIVFVGDPGDSIVGWCELCEKFVCSRCSLKVEIPEAQWQQFPGVESLKTMYQYYNTSPRLLRCKRCSSVLHKGDHMKVLLLNSYKWTMPR